MSVFFSVLLLACIGVAIYAFLSTSPETKTKVDNKPIVYNNTICMEYRGWPRGSGATTRMIEHAAKEATRDPNRKVYVVFGTESMAIEASRKAPLLDNLRLCGQYRLNENSYRGIRAKVFFDETVNTNDNNNMFCWATVAINFLYEAQQKK